MMSYSHTMDYLANLKKRKSFMLYYEKNLQDTLIGGKSKVQNNEYTVLHFV